jgi:cysteine desulfurase
MAIYLDHNAGSPMRPQVRAALAALNFSGNPASVHHSGQAARSVLEQARARVADLIGARPTSIVFTSGGTEANHLALLGVLEADPARRAIVTTAIEHSSILHPLEHLARTGVQVRIVPPDSQGRVDPAELIAHVDHQTALVSVGLANAEVGTIQDLSGLADAAHRAGALLHLDGVAAAGKMALAVDELECDLLSLSAHKLGGPAGSGALFVRDRARIRPWLWAGAQEHGMRAGTPNLLGAAGFGIAASIVRDEWSAEMARLAPLAAEFASHLMVEIPGLRANHPAAGGLYNTLNFTFPAVRGETLLIALDLAGVEVSMGSACAAGAVEPSHVLLAMGRGEGAARSSLRISLGYTTTAQDLAAAATIIPRVWRQVAQAEGVQAMAS